MAQRLKVVSQFESLNVPDTPLQCDPESVETCRPKSNDGIDTKPLCRDDIPGMNAFKIDTWQKALQLLNIKGSTPGGGKTVLSSHIPETETKRGGKGHVFVNMAKWSCECTIFISRHICKHVVAVARKEGIMDECLEFMAKRRGKMSPNLMSLYRDRISQDCWVETD